MYHIANGNFASYNSMLFLKTKVRGNKVYLIKRGVLLPGRPKAALT